MTNCPSSELKRKHLGDECGKEDLVSMKGSMPVWRGLVNMGTAFLSMGCPLPHGYSKQAITRCQNLVLDEFLASKMVRDKCLFFNKS